MRATATAVVAAVALTSCGLAALSSRAVAPERASRPQAPAPKREAPAGRVMRDAYYERARQEALVRRDPASLLAYGEAAYQDGRFSEAVAAFEQGLARGSAEGVFTLRGSYPQALRAICREQDALRVQQRLSATALVPTVAAPPPDSTALRIAVERMLQEPVHFSD